MAALRLLDLFSGIGGFSLGLERTGGFRTVGFCDNSPSCRHLLKHHWPDVPCYEDVRLLNGDRLRRERVFVDAICGGFPCQDISFAGTGEGLAGARSGLWSEYARLVGDIRPRIVFVENVSALLVRGFGTVLGDLAALGYDAWWDCIPASAVGAPHRRDRLWLIAYPGGVEHQGFGDALRRAIAEELPQAYRANTGLSPWADGEAFAQRPDTDDTGPYRASVHVVGNAELRDEQDGVAGSVGQDVADAAGGGPRRRRPRSDAKPLHGSALADTEHGGFGRRDPFGRGPGAAMPSGWRLAEPDMGRGLDGFPGWLDRSVGSKISYAESIRRTEVLRRLWTDHVSSALRRAAGGLERLQQAEVLFSFVREYESGADEARLLVAGAEASEDFLRSLRERAVARGAPRRSGQDEQRAGEHPDAVQSVSRLLACDGEARWATCGWEDATPRTAVGVPGRAQRLHGLGNAVVPEIPYRLGRAVLSALAPVSHHHPEAA